MLLLTDLTRAWSHVAINGDTPGDTPARASAASEPSSSRSSSGGSAQSAAVAVPIPESAAGCRTVWFAVQVALTRTKANDLLNTARAKGEQAGRTRRDRV